MIYFTDGSFLKYYEYNHSTGKRVILHKLLRHHSGECANASHPTKDSGQSQSLMDSVNFFGPRFTKYVPLPQAYRVELQLTSKPKDDLIDRHINWISDNIRHNWSFVPMIYSPDDSNISLIKVILFYFENKVEGYKFKLTFIDDAFLPN